MTSSENLPEATLYDQQVAALRLHALEQMPASKRSVRQAEELAELQHLLGSTYERALAVTRKRFADVIASPRFALLREYPSTDEIERVLSQLGDAKLPERVGLMSPTQAADIRTALANNLASAAGIRRSAERNAAELEARVKELEERWMGMSPADREWRMVGEIAEMMGPLRDKSRQVRGLATMADSVYWQLRMQLETVRDIMYDWDRQAGRGVPSRASTAEDNSL